MDFFLVFFPWLYINCIVNLIIHSGSKLVLLIKKGQIFHLSSLFPLPVSLIDWLPDLYCHSPRSWQGSPHMHHFVCSQVTGCNSPCMRQVPSSPYPPPSQALCITDNLYKEVRFTPPGPRTFPLSHQRIWIWLNSDAGETVGPWHAWLMWSL